MRHPISFVAAAAGLLLSQGASACRPFTPDTPPADLVVDRPVTAEAKARIRADTAYIANCTAVRDSAARYEGAPVLLWTEVDTEAELKKSDDLPQFDDLSLGAGRVMSYYLISPEGHAEPHFVRITYATRPALETSVRQFLGRATYKPATLGGRPVRVCVRQEFFFQLG